MIALDLPPKLWLPPKPAIIRPADPPALVEAMPFMIGFRKPGLAPLAFAFVTNTESNSTTTSYSFSAVSLGAAAADRHIFVVVVFRSATLNGHISSASIGGVTAAILSPTGHGALAGAGTLNALVPTGTTGTIALTMSETTGYCAIAVYRVTGLLSTTPVSQAWGTTAVDLSSSTAGGFVIAGHGDTNSSAITWGGGLTRDVDGNSDDPDHYTMASAFPASGSAYHVTANGGSNDSLVAQTFR